jgi:hypothetical protein
MKRSFSKFLQLCDEWSDTREDLEKQVDALDNLSTQLTHTETYHDIQPDPELFDIAYKMNCGMQRTMARIQEKIKKLHLLLKQLETLSKNANFQAMSHMTPLKHSADISLVELAAWMNGSLTLTLPYFRLLVINYKLLVKEGNLLEFRESVKQLKPLMTMDMADRYSCFLSK